MNEYIGPALELLGWMLAIIAAVIVIAATVQHRIDENRRCRCVDVNATEASP